MDSSEFAGPRRRRIRWEERIQRAVIQRRIFPFLALSTAGLGVLAGFVVTLVDRQDFPTFGTGIWWAIVTLGTVGYGDVVPHTAWGRVVGSAVIVLGVTFISFLTATVTSYFVAAEEARAEEREREERAQEIAESMAALRRIEERLAAIDERLRE